MNDQLKKTAYYGIRFGLGFVFIYAGIPKIMDPAGFAENIDHYRILPYFLVSLTALILPWLEVMIGFSLISGLLLKGSSLLVIVLNCLFIMMILSAIIRGLDISCGCFSTSGEGDQVGVMRLLEDLAFLGAGIWIYRSSE